MQSTLATRCIQIFTNLVAVQSTSPLTTFLATSVCEIHCDTSPRGTPLRQSLRRTFGSCPCPDLPALSPSAIALMLTLVPRRDWRSHRDFAILDDHDQDRGRTSVETSADCKSNDDRSDSLARSLQGIQTWLRYVQRTRDDAVQAGFGEVPRHMQPRMQPPLLST